MIQWVYERSKTAKSLNKIIIATDDERIRKAAADFGAEVIMTSPEHNCGTERVAEAAKNLDVPIIINIQGDEPQINGEMIDSLTESLQDDSIPMATLAVKNSALALIEDKNIVKLVFNKPGYALFFSRSAIPYQPADFFWQHIGIYGYQRNFLLKYPSLPVSRLEKTESLEQLRALENGFRIKIIESQFSTLSVNTPQDIIKVEKKLKNEKNV